MEFYPHMWLEANIVDGRSSYGQAVSLEKALTYSMASGAAFVQKKINNINKVI